MGLKVGVVAVVVCVFTPVSSQAQFIWDWGQQQYTQQRLTPPQSRRYRGGRALPTERTSRPERARATERTTRPERANRDKRTKSKERVKSPWHDMSQDQAREWLKQQVQSFCSKYPKDQNCYWPEGKKDDGNKE
jgi:hypothetical protein